MDRRGEAGEGPAAQPHQTGRQLSAASGPEPPGSREALAVQRDRYQALFDFAPDGYLITDPEGIIQEANCAAARLLNIPPGELVGKALERFVPRSDRHLLREQLAVLAALVAGRPSRSGRDAHAGEEPVTSAEMHLRPRRGAAFPAVLKVAATEDREPPASLRWLIRDVSERKRAESERDGLLLELQRQRDTVEALALALERDWGTLQTIMDNTDTCLAYLDHDFRLQRFNPAFARHWGTDETELLERGHFRMSPDADNRAILEQVRTTGRAMSLRACPVTQAGVGRGGTTHWDWTLAPVKDGSGRVQGLVLSLLDVTEEVRSAQERAQAQAVLHRQNEHLIALMDELDAFAHTVAHDLKQPLTIVFGFADMLSEEIGSDLDEQARSMLEGIKNGAKRMNNIVEGLLLLASTRRSDVTPRPLDMAGLVHEVLQSLRLEAAVAEAGGKLLLPASWPKAVGYGPWVESVWANYLTNALKYGGQPPKIEVGGEQLPEGDVRFWVRDNGRGLTSAEQSRLFLSFTRLGQPRSLGHGLGLTIVRRIVERLGGDVGVESEPGKGSTFWFTLPAGS